MRGRSLSTEKNNLKITAWARWFFESYGGTWLLCLIFTLAMLYHCVVPLGAVLFTEGIKGQDCGQMIWNLWTVNEAVSGGHNPYTTKLIYYPAGATNLVYHSLAAGFFPVTFLVKQLSGGDVMYPFYAYRLIILLSFSLILFFSYATLRRAGFSRWASFIPAVAYAFSDFYMEHVIHLNHLAGFFIPLTALALLRLYQQPRTSNAVVAALVAAFAVYFTEFSLYIYVGTMSFALILCALKGERKLVLEKIERLGLKGMLLSLAVFLMVIAPYMFNLLMVSVLKPKAFEASLYSANLAGFFIPDQLQTPLYGSLFASLRSRVTAGMGESGIFAGFPLLLCGLVALLSDRRKLVRVPLLMSALFFALSLGPTLKIFSTDTGIRMPYSLLAQLPPFNTGRTPVRFVVMGMFFLMIVAAYGVSWAEGKLRRRWSARLCALAMASLLFWTIAEVYAPVARQKPFVPPKGLGKIVKGPVLNLPLARNDGYAAMLQVLHRQPIATGYLARYTAEQWQQYSDLERNFYRGGAQFCSSMKEMGVRNIIIAPLNISPDAPSVIPLDLSKCSINVVDLRKEDSGDAASKDEPEQPKQFPRLESGRRIDFRAAESDQYLWYGWSGREACCRWSNAGRAALVFSLEKVGAGRLEIRMGPFIVPGKVNEQRVEVELNGRPLTALDLKEAEPKMYSIELPANLLSERNVLTLNLPDAESPATLKLSEDSRLLGINVQWIQIEQNASR
jgi:hypothetical protein